MKYSLVVAKLTLGVSMALVAALVVPTLVAASASAETEKTIAATAQTAQHPGPITSTTAASQTFGEAHPWNFWFTFVIGRTSATKIWKKLNTCFNCSIPITGAPRSFPQVGDRIPFTLNRFGDEEFSLTQTYNYTNQNTAPGVNSGMILTGTERNIAGSGSVMNVDFLTRDTDGQTIMTVAANLTNDFGSSGRRDAYERFMQKQWATVALQIHQEITR